MEHLKLSPRRGARVDEGILRPTENGINANLLRGNVGNRDVLCQMPEISNVRSMAGICKDPQDWAAECHSWCVAAETE